MINQVDAIKIGLNKYYEYYSKAIEDFWDSEKHIYGIPLQNFFIAQAVQESRFNPLAKSPVGAKGIAQFMYNTAKGLEKNLSNHYLFKKGFDREDPIQSIYAQVFYMNKLFKTWSWERSNLSKMQLALASYNAGIGNILLAQEKSKNKKHWIEISNYLSYVTSYHSKETITYVSNITDMALIVEDYKIT